MTRAMNFFVALTVLISGTAFAGTPSRYKTRVQIKLTAGKLENQIAAIKKMVSEHSEDTTVNSSDVYCYYSEIIQRQVYRLLFLAQQLHDTEVEAASVGTIYTDGPESDFAEHMRKDMTAIDYYCSLASYKADNRIIVSENLKTLFDKLGSRAAQNATFEERRGRD